MHLAERVASHSFSFPSFSYVHVDRRNQCRDVFAALKHHQEFLKGSRCMYNDFQSLLYSLDELVPAEDKVSPVIAG